MRAVTVAELRNILLGHEDEDEVFISGTMEDHIVITPPNWWDPEYYRLAATD